MTIMIDRPMPGLAPWRSYFQDVELPVFRRTVQRLDVLRQAPDAVKVGQIAAVILHDPFLVLRVFAYLRKHFDEGKLATIATVDRAVMMIGVLPFLEKFVDLPLVENQMKAFPKATLGMLKAVARARQAAKWSRVMAVLRRDLAADEIALATLVHDFPQMLLWCFAPVLSIKAQERAAAAPGNVPASMQPALQAAVQAAEFGVGLEQLKRALAADWHLPPALANVMDADQADTPRVRNTTLAVELAAQTASGWNQAAVAETLQAIEELLRVDRATLLDRLGAPEEMIGAVRAAVPIVASDAG